MEKVTIEIYLNRNDEDMFGVYGEDGILIEDGFYTYDVALTWANEHGYDTDED